MKQRRKTCPYQECPVSPNTKICAYEECHLPENNNKYWYQLVYLIVSIFILLRNNSDFTFYSLFMFTSPILLDLIFVHFDGKLYRVIKIVYIIVNTALAVICLVGMFEFLVDNGNTFAVVADAIILQEINIRKSWLAIPMGADLLIPVIMVFACPTKRSKEMSEFLRECGKEGTT